MYYRIEERILFVPEATKRIRRLVMKFWDYRHDSFRVPESKLKYRRLPLQEILELISRSSQFQITCICNNCGKQHKSNIDSREEYLKDMSFIRTTLREVNCVECDSKNSEWPDFYWVHDDVDW